MHPIDWHTLWSNLMHLGTPDSVAHPVSLIEKVIRPVVVYLLLVIGLKAFGKRILAQLNPFDFVVLLTLANTVQNAIIGNDSSLLGGVLGAAALLGVNALLVRAYYRGASTEHMQSGERDIVLIDQGRLQEREMQRLHINAGELTAKAHERGFDWLDDVERAVLYPNGTIYFQAKAQVTETARYAELIRRIDLLSTQVAALRK
ncbi:MAG TPA: YetF domain-containing protein [Gemmatimonadales bacterium]|jgi:uncharacterized membrane protein YcaP (DUF421 family)|nr:YetF domain-containing protein [Gemmatimonadales bacterium]